MEGVGFPPGGASARSPVCTVWKHPPYLHYASNLNPIKMLSNLARTSTRLAVRHGGRHAITASVGALNEKHTLVLIRFDLTRYTEQHEYKCSTARHRSTVHFITGALRGHADRPGHSSCPSLRSTL